MIVSTNTNFFVDICEVLRLFFPLAEINQTPNFVLDAVLNTSGEWHNLTVTLTNNEKSGNSLISPEIYYGSKVQNFKKNIKTNCQLDYKKQLKRFVKTSVYSALSNFLNTTKDWGSHTGVRPTRLAHELLAQGMSTSQIEDFLVKEYNMSLNKAQLTVQVIGNQGALTTSDRHIHFYVHIPFCPSRCSYCSFITFDCKNNLANLQAYLNALLTEIEHAKQLIAQHNLVVQSVYVGGGTPTTLPADMLGTLLASLNFDVPEFTVESGRPDTITTDRLDVMQKCGVTRICINPQTFKDETLRTIGRHHTTKQTLQAFALAKNYPFAINMDLIAGLPNEGFEDFSESLQQSISLNPSSITVHTLSIKNGSEMIKEAEAKQFDSDVTTMVNYAKQQLTKHNYQPYYLYRQKHQLSSQENIGYALPKHACRFNIESMEETSTILACGAGAISKRVFHAENRIERSANIKPVSLYIERLPEILDRKTKLFNQGW